MKKIINVILAMVSIVSFVLTLMYLYRLNHVFDSAVIEFFDGVVFVFPIFMCINFIESIKSKIETQNKASKGKFKYLSKFILPIGLTIIALYFLIDTNFYHLSSYVILEAVVVLVMIELIQIITDKKSNKVKPQIVLSVIIVHCILLSTVVFSYLQIVQPITLEDAKTKVEQEYPNENYEYFKVDTDESEKRLGAYCFVNDKGENSTHIRVGIDDGKITK